MKNIFLKLTFSLLLGALFALTPKFIFAATLELSSEGATRGLGEIFSVNVLVGSEGEKINATTGKIFYDKSRLTLKSAEVADSVVTFWVTPPKDLIGQIDFEGIILSDKSLLAKERVMRLVFETKASGLANIYFLEGSVLKDDGKATNILDKFINTSVSINKTRTPVVSGGSVTIASVPKEAMENTSAGEVLGIAILEYPSRVDPKEEIMIRGIAGPKEKIFLNLVLDRANSLGERLLRILKNDPGEMQVTTESDAEGKFSYELRRSMTAGAYNVWAEKIIPDNEEKVSSDEVVINVKYAPFYKTWIIIVNALMLLVPIAILGILVFTMFWRGFREVRSVHDGMHEEK